MFLRSISHSAGDLLLPGKGSQECPSPPMPLRSLSVDGRLGYYAVFALTCPKQKKYVTGSKWLAVNLTESAAGLSNIWFTQGYIKDVHCVILFYRELCNVLLCAKFVLHFLLRLKLISDVTNLESSLCAPC